MYSVKTSNIDEIVRKCWKFVPHYYDRKYQCLIKVFAKIYLIYFRKTVLIIVQLVQYNATAYYDLVHRFYLSYKYNYSSNIGGVGTM